MYIYIYIYIKLNYFYFRSLRYDYLGRTLAVMKKELRNIFCPFPSVTGAV